MRKSTFSRRLAFSIFKFADTRAGNFSIFFIIAVFLFSGLFCNFVPPSRRPKETPKSAQELPKAGFIDYGWDLKATLVDKTYLGPPRSSQGAPESPPGAPKSSPRRTPEPPRSSQGAPESSPGAPQSSQRASKERPRAPKSSQGAPLSPQEAPKASPRRHKMPQEAPQSTPKPPRAPLLSPHCRPEAIRTYTARKKKVKARRKADVDQTSAVRRRWD